MTRSQPSTRCTWLPAAALALLATACAAAPPTGSAPEPQLAPTGAASPALTATEIAESARPPKPCRGGEAQGTGSIWTLEFREGDSPWYAKRWSHRWSDWTAGQVLPRGEDLPIQARIYVHDNWSISLILERDGQMLAASRLGYVDPCSYASRDRDRNLIRFYRTRL